MDIAVSRARMRFAEVVDIVHDRNERVRLLRRGRPAAALVSSDDLEPPGRLEDAADLRPGNEAPAGPGSAGPPIPREEVDAQSRRLDRRR
jgi:prevent-host-death family protein